ncbi:probable JmjC domain-containing histone demethylation protein 2C isoform X2 [Cylas formicarius]|uniref:probable JmjC domain-containing histone demethylation protein 2C isoform X2 n=1 Tax=Cylas formicarius TaxID=197179 RepID=UPI00295838A4|nr:probable JmjC domain-containing histone demethylation protein 2C isoform X2 [Cylas formicarius]
MAYKCREEIVGKRFLSVSSGFTKIKGKVRDWNWRAGVIRAATHKDSSSQDLQVLVEYDDAEWQRREWMSVYRENLFHVFLVEQALVWADRRDPVKPSNGTVLWPALTFMPLVSNIEIPGNLLPVEFLLDRELAFKEYRTLKPYQEWDPSLRGVRDYPELRLAVKRWIELQDGQRILLTTPSVLVGYRVEVYRAEGTTQWYTAVIIGYNEATRDLTVTDDTVLEEHNEDPALVQMRLIGDGESIMRGENVGITPRRSRSSALLNQQNTQLLQNRVIRGLANTVTTCQQQPNSTSGAVSKRPRSRRSGISETGNSPESPDKGYGTKSKKRKPSETDTPTTRLRYANSIKEDLENNQSRSKNHGRSVNKKKVLEEANNSKLREIEVVVEDCLQNGSLYLNRALLEEPPLSEESEDTPPSVEFRDDEPPSSLECQREEDESSSTARQSKPSSPAAVEEETRKRDREGEAAIDDRVSVVSGESVHEESEEADESVQCNNSGEVKEEVELSACNSEDDCVIVANINIGRTIISTPTKADREPDCSIRGDDDGPLSSSSPFSRMDFNSETPNSLRFPDDRSDSGVSSLRSGSGDERSGSRSSALSSTDEPNTSGHISSASSNTTQPATRSPLFIPAASSGHHHQQQQQQLHQEQVRVWRDPSLLLEEPHIRHIHSVQHQTLLMSHPTTPASSGPQPPTSAPGSHPSSIYPPVPPSSLMPPHHLAPHHPHLSPHTLYHSPFSDIIWKQRYAGVPTHLLGQQTGHPTDEQLLERERAAALIQDRHHTERMIRQSQELEKQHKEKERLERERQEREKMEREREREKQEREREEKERQEQALHNHFEKSLRAAQQKREQWNSIGGGRPPPSRASEDERKEMHQREQHHQQQQQRHLASVRSAADPNNHRSYYPVQQQQKQAAKSDYPPPPAHSRMSSAKAATDKLPNVHPSIMQKGELAIYGYQVQTAPQNAYYEPKKGAELQHKTTPGGGLVVTKTNPMDLPNPPPLVSEMKNSVIVKHDAKNPHHLEPRVSIALSPSPKLRNDMIGHYMSSAGSQKANIYEYRSPTQSPHHLPHSASPHHHLDSKTSGQQHRQLPSPHHHRQSPHGQQHASPDLRFRTTSDAGGVGGAQQTMVFPSGSTKPYPFLSTTAAAVTAFTASNSSSANSKPKVSSPAPHHIYGKPSAGMVSVVPVATRPPVTHDAVPMPLPKPPSASPSPYQQVSQYHIPALTAAPSIVTCPPPAHSSRTTSAIDRYERMYPAGPAPPGGLSVKLLNQPGTSPPTASSAPLPASRTHPGFGMSPGLPQVQTQPLDLGVGSNKSSEKPQPSFEVMRRRLLRLAEIRAETETQQQQQPQLARVSEPSPLIASAATTITTLVNTAAYRNLPTTTTTTVAAVAAPPTVLTENLPDLSVTPVTTEAARPPSAESITKPATPPPSNAGTPTPPTSVTPAPPPSEESPGTPLKPTSVTPSAVDSEKSNSPGPQKTSSSSSYPVRHLKKAWLQRHTGEDLEDTTGVVGSGSCVTLPLNINRPSPPPSKNESPVNSIHSVGSMAVNSISKTKHFTSKNAANRKAKESSSSSSSSVNGHPSDNSKGGGGGGGGGDDSSSSDQERGGRKSPPKRKPPKVKRKKGGGGLGKKPPVDDKKRKLDKPAVSLASESGSDSDKESGSEKDSDSGASTVVSGNGGGCGGKKPNGKEPRKRGRRPKGSKNDKGEEPRAKKSKDEPQRDPFRKPPVGQLKKTGESFLQDGPCFEVAPKLAKCRECRWTPNQRSRNMPNIFCRFYAFRRLRYTKNGQLAIAGFSDPHKDPLEDDVKLWLPNPDSPPSDLDLDTSRFLLKQVGDHFCDLLVQEKETHDEHMADDKTVAWKRVVQGVREMCDVCETTLFNFHWACGKCGFVVCLDCYKSRKHGTIKSMSESGKDRDEFAWLLCTNRQGHEQEKLMLTQIIADDCLLKLGKMVHEMRELWGIEQFCACPNAKDVKLNNVECKEIVKLILAEKLNGVKKDGKEETKAMNGVKEEKNSPLNWLADVALSNSEEKKQDGGGSSSEEEGNFSTLRELLIRPSHKANGSSRAASPVTKSGDKKKSKSDSSDDPMCGFGLGDVPVKQEKEEEAEQQMELKHFVRRYNWQNKGRQQLPIRIMTLTESKLLYPNVPHSWLCDGKLLRLSDANCKENYKIFQDQWKRGQPVIVSDVTKNIDKDLWNPDAFARDFGDEKNDLINCMTGNLVPNQPMRKFWEGFDHFSKRLKDDRGQPMLLKLKDWPPGEDFAEMLPSRFADLMKVLPLDEYTHRSGRLNLASRLPDCFVRPDLGPKMYNAYGSALHPNKGTTNLHLDISDAVNVMVYVGIPKDGDSEEHIKEAFRAIDEAGCDILTRRRVRDKGELPGALWHIYNARDADKIRDLLNKVTVEKGGRLEPHNDPIHDQSGYLDGPLRERLYKEYGVEGYAIVQCLGDAVFIPAGAPHQVRNLHNCIKVAEDFVSPENVSHCFHLTQEFRDLSDTHSNHEDKLQIKNIIYHAVKDALATLGALMNRQSGRRIVACDATSEPNDVKNVIMPPTP